MVYGGKSFLGLRKDLLRSIGAATGDEVSIELTEVAAEEHRAGRRRRCSGVDGAAGRQPERRRGVRGPAVQSSAGIRPMGGRGENDRHES